MVPRIEALVESRVRDGVSSTASSPSVSKAQASDVRRCIPATRKYHIKTNLASGGAPGKPLPGVLPHTRFLHF